jgi:hypothetical protein
MAVRGDGRIEPGQKLGKAISARAWNRAQDAADIVLASHNAIVAGNPANTFQGTTIIKVRNQSGFFVPIHGVLQLSTPAISPVGGDLTGDEEEDTNAKEFQQNVLMNGVTPTANSGRFCVLLEPVQPNAIARAAVAGVFACRVKIPQAQTYSYAVTRANDRTQLLAASCGPVRLLWNETTAGDNKWAVAVL